MLSRHFLSRVVPFAIWMFGPAAIATAFLTGMLQDDLGGQVVIFIAVLMALVQLAGNLAQPLVRRVDDPAKPGPSTWASVSRSSASAPGRLGAWSGQPVVIVTATLVLGYAYGCCQ